MALATRPTSHWRFWSRKNADKTPKIDVNPVLGTPSPPAGSPAAAAAALDLPYPLPVATSTAVDLSPLASGMHSTDNVAHSDEFAIKAYTGKDRNHDCNGASPTARGAVTRAPLSDSSLVMKKALTMTSTCDAAVQTDLSNAEDVTVDSNAALTAEPAPAGVTNNLNDGKVNYAWGNSGHTMRLSPATAAKLCMRVVVPEEFSVDPTAELALNASITPAISNSETPPLDSYVSAAISDGPIKDAPTPASSPTDSLIFSMSPDTTPSDNALNESAGKIDGNKRPPPIRTSTFDVSAIMLKLANNGVTPPPSTTSTGKSFSEMSLKELLSTPLAELYPGLYGSDDELLVQL